MLYCNFTSLAFLGLLGFLRRQLKTRFIATLLRAAKGYDPQNIRVQFVTGILVGWGMRSWL